MEPYDGRDVAAYIAQRCKEQGLPHNNLKVQALLYCVYGVLLAREHRRACDESPCCHSVVPIFPKVHNHMEKGGQIECFSRKVEEGDDLGLKEAVEDVLDVFGQTATMLLCKWTCGPDTPWEHARNERGVPQDNFLNQEDIESYFADKVPETLKRRSLGKYARSYQGQNGI